MLNHIFWLWINIRSIFYCRFKCKFTLLIWHLLTGSHTPSHPPSPSFIPLMCNKQRLCTMFTQNILCLVSCRCTQNSCCCSSPQHPIVRALNHISLPSKNRRRSSILKPPTPHPKHQASSSVLHKKREGGKKQHENPNGLPGERTTRRRRQTMQQADPIYRHTLMHACMCIHRHLKTRARTSAIPLQENFLFFLLLNPTVVMIHNVWEQGVVADGPKMNQLAHTHTNTCTNTLTYTEHRWARTQGEPERGKYKHPQLHTMTISVNYAFADRIASSKKLYTRGAKCLHSAASRCWVLEMKLFRCSFKHAFYY